MLYELKRNYLNKATSVKNNRQINIMKLCGLNNLVLKTEYHASGGVEIKFEKAIT